MLRQLWKTLKWVFLFFVFIFYVIAALAAHNAQGRLVPALVIFGIVVYLAFRLKNYLGKSKK